VIPNRLKLLSATGVGEWRVCLKPTGIQRSLGLIGPENTRYAALSPSNQYTFATAPNAFKYDWIQHFSSTGVWPRYRAGSHSDRNDCAPPVGVDSTLLPHQSCIRPDPTRSTSPTAYRADARWRNNAHGSSAGRPADRRSCGSGCGRFNAYHASAIR